MLSIGLMSGTSMDGIDAALLKTDGTQALLQDLGHTSIAYEPCFKILLKAAEFCVRRHQGDLEKAHKQYHADLKLYLCQELQIPEAELPKHIQDFIVYLYGKKHSHHEIGLNDVIKHSTELHGFAVKQLLNETGFNASEIDVVGYHGQTLFHRPENQCSVIVGNGKYLAEDLGITVVNDFRQCDVKAGGQGAPFAPLYHFALAVKDQKYPLVVVNCGGIANLTYIPSVNENEIIGFDSGPGNGLIDTLIRLRTQGIEAMDRDGKYGLQGKLQPSLLKALYAKAVFKQGQNFFHLKGPRSLDYGDLNLIPEVHDYSLEDACKTLEVFTADTIVDSFEALNVSYPKYWVLAGGGWHNPVIREQLISRIHSKDKTVQVLMADKMNWNSTAMEAQIFAYLAVRSLQNKPLSLPSTTRIPKPLSGGHAHVPAKGATPFVQILLDANPYVLTGYQFV
jgi:anhydro-N-acetylmuramic acid kinase